MHVGLLNNVYLPSPDCSLKRKYSFFSSVFSFVFRGMFFSFLLRCRMQCIGKDERETAGCQRSTRAPNERWKSHSAEAIIFLLRFPHHQIQHYTIRWESGNEVAGDKVFIFPFSVGFLFLSWLSNRRARHHVLYQMNFFFFSVWKQSTEFSRTHLSFLRNVFKFAFAGFGSLFLFGRKEIRANDFWCESIYA